MTKNQLQPVDILWVDSSQQVAQLLSLLKGTYWIAVDTEADSYFSYPPRLCLIQLYFPKGVAIIDPLANFDITPLLNAIKSIEWIIHSAHYDLSLLYQTYRFIPKRIFDTMLAARMVGEVRYGLETLLYKYLGIELDKSLRTANWNQRPLPELLLTYAVNDVFYLKRLADILRQKLQELGRLEWLNEMCEAMTSPYKWESIREAWRIKGSKNLGPKGLAVLRELWSWREKQAIATKSLPNNIITSRLMLKIAKTAETGGLTDAMAQIPISWPEEKFQQLIKVVRNALSLPPEQMPQPISYNRASYLTPSQRRYFDYLRSRVLKIANKLGLEPSFIASKALILQIVTTASLDQVKMFQWQKKLLFDETL